MAEGVPRILINIKTPKEHKTASVYEDATVKELKEEVSKLFDEEVQQIGLLANGKVLKDENRLKQYGVQEGCNVNLVIKKYIKNLDDRDKKTSVSSVESLFEHLIPEMKNTKKEKEEQEKTYESSHDDESDNEEESLQEITFLRSLKDRNCLSEIASKIPEINEIIQQDQSFSMLFNIPEETKIVEKLITEYLKIKKFDLDLLVESDEAQMTFIKCMIKHDPTCRLVPEKVDEITTTFMELINIDGYESKFILTKNFAVASTKRPEILLASLKVEKWRHIVFENIKNKFSVLKDSITIDFLNVEEKEILKDIIIDIMPIAPFLEKLKIFEKVFSDKHERKSIYGNHIVQHLLTDLSFLKKAVDFFFTQNINCFDSPLAILNSMGFENRELNLVALKTNKGNINEAVEDIINQLSTNALSPKDQLTDSIKTSVAPDSLEETFAEDKDNQNPEEMYAKQLEQLVLMGFENKEANVAALIGCDGKMEEVIELFTNSENMFDEMKASTETTEKNEILNESNENFTKVDETTCTKNDETAELSKEIPTESSDATVIKSSIEKNNYLEVSIIETANVIDNSSTNNDSVIKLEECSKPISITNFNEETYQAELETECNSDTSEKANSDEQYSKQLKQLDTMGFENKEKNLEALVKCDGKMEETIELLANSSTLENNHDHNTNMHESSSESDDDEDQDLHEEYASQLEQLNALGFTDVDSNLIALKSYLGDIDKAVDFFLNQQSTESCESDEKKLTELKITTEDISVSKDNKPENSILWSIQDLEEIFATELEKLFLNGFVGKNVNLQAIDLVMILIEKIINVLLK